MAGQVRPAFSAFGSGGLDTRSKKVGRARADILADERLYFRQVNAYMIFFL
jgi:hypothetical protein